MARIGPTLRNTRLERGLTIEQVAQDTRISPRFLDALEREDFEELPAPVYVRGFLRSYANYLRIDPVPLLSQLAQLESAPPSVGTGTVAGPPPVQGPARPPSSDPFGRSAPPPAPRPPEPPEPEDERAGTGTPAAGAVTGPIIRRGAGQRIAVAEPPPAEREPRPARRRPAGVLAERPGGDGGGGGGARFLALLGGGFILLLVALGLALVLTRGDDDDAAASASVTPGTVLPETVVAVGSRTPAASPSASASARASSTASPSPAGSASPTLEGSQPTPTGTPGASATPTSGESPTATPTEQPTATPTDVPPTPTPTEIPPTPTRTPVISHPTGLEECFQAGSCGTPVRVICPPDGIWFADLPSINGSYQNPGWPETQASGTQDAINKGEAGCQG